VAPETRKTGERDSSDWVIMGEREWLSVTLGGGQGESGVVEEKGFPGKRVNWVWERNAPERKE